MASHGKISVEEGKKRRHMHRPKQRTLNAYEREIFIVKN
jgi:hypothetical protein